MNSKQRRKDHRTWKYIVEFDHDNITWDDYFAMWDWTAANFGTDLSRWRESHNHIGTRWEFKREREAIAFKLRWGGK